MAKSIDDEFRAYWYKAGRVQDRAYEDTVHTAERAFKAGAEVVIKRMRNGDSVSDEKGSDDA